MGYSLIESLSPFTICPWPNSYALQAKFLIDGQPSFGIPRGSEKSIELPAEPVLSALHPLRANVPVTPVLSGNQGLLFISLVSALSSWMLNFPF